MIGTTLARFCPPAAQLIQYLGNLKESQQQNSSSASDLKPGVRTAPQVYKNIEGKISLLRQAPPLRNLVLPGGGFAGWIMPSAIAKMDSVLFEGVRNISGCSCGSLVALLLGSGLSPRDLEAKMNAVSIPSLLESVPDFGEQYPAVAFIPEGIPSKFSSILLGLMRMAAVTVVAKEWQQTGQRFVQVLDQWSSETVSSNLKNPQIWNKAKSLYQAKRLGNNPAENEKNWLRLNFLKESQWIEGSQAPRTEQMITFSDNALLHHVDPVIFKKINIVAANVADKGSTDISIPLELEKVFFNAESTPSTPIVEAGRFSMSIPLFFQNIWGDGHRYTDGGLVSLNPVEIFYSADKVEGALAERIKQAKQAETLLFAFANAEAVGELNNILYQPPSKAIFPTLVNCVLQWFLNYPEFSARSEQDKRKLYEAGPNVAIIDHGEVSSFDVHVSKEKIDAARKLTYLSIDKYFEDRKNQAWTLTFDSVQEAISVLSEEEKLAVKKVGHPNLDPTFKDLPLHTKDAQIEFYERAIAGLKSSWTFSSTSDAKMAVGYAA